MNLVINIDATDKSEAAVASVADRTPVDELDELILGNQEPLTIAFCDDAGDIPAWVTDPVTMLVVGLGLPDLLGGKSYAATDDFDIDGTTRTGVLNLDTTALRDALALACKNCAEDAGRWLTLEIAKVDANGQTETLALLHVMVLWRVLDTPANNTTYRYPAVLYDSQTGLLYRPSAIPVLSGGVPRGGSVNQVLTKVGPDDFDVDWRDGGTGSGSVTSVGLTMPDIFSVTGSPVTGAGTLAAALVAQAANRVFAGPTSGGNAVPSFRTLVEADIPDLSSLYLSPASAAATYLTQADAASTYLTIASAIVNFQPIDSTLTALSALADSSGWLHNNGAGVLAWSTPTKSDIGLGNVENIPLSTWAGSTNLITLGTITTGTWQASTIAVARGGTGVTSLGDITRANDTNVTLTLGGTPIGAVITSTSFTLGWTGTLAVGRGGTGVSSLGDITRTNDTNVTLTLGGSPTGAVITSTSFTLGWSGTLAVGRGGTGLGSYTTGDLLYASGSTTLAGLAAVAANQVLVSAGTGTAPAWSGSPRLAALGLGVAAAAGPLLRITNNSSGLPAAYSTSQVVLHVGNTDSTAPAILIDGSGAGGLLELRRAGGTVASPTQVTNGTILGTIGWRGYATTTTFTNRRAEISATALEDWTSLANGTKIEFNVTAPSTTTLATYMILTSASLSLNAPTLAISGGSGAALITLQNTATGSGGTDGAFLNMGAGGTDVRLWNYEAGSIIFATSNAQAWAINSTGILTGSATTDASSTSTGSLITGGGLGVAKKSYIGDILTVSVAGNSAETAHFFGPSVTSGNPATVVVGRGVTASTATYLAHFYNSTDASNYGELGIYGIGANLRLPQPGGLTVLRGAIKTASSSVQNIAQFLSSAGDPYIIVGDEGSTVQAFMQGQTGTPRVAFGSVTNHDLDLRTNNTVRVTVNTSGAVRFHSYGAGTLVTDASGNITASSDRELKIIRGPFVRGLGAICALKPVLYLWNEKSGMEMRNLYAGFIAQDVEAVIPEAVGMGALGYRSLADRPIICAVVNAVQELTTRLEAIERKAAA